VKKTLSLSGAIGPSIPTETMSWFGGHIVATAGRTVLQCRLTQPGVGVLTTNASPKPPP
jgi:hypothetical protein